MSILKLPAAMRSYTNGLMEIPVQAGTAGEAVSALVAQYPALQPHLHNSRGELRPFVNFFLGVDNIRDLQSLATPLKDGDILRLVLAVAGGCNAT